MHKEEAENYLHQKVEKILVMRMIRLELKILIHLLFNSIDILHISDNS